jgi:hypothetical protein
VEVHLITVEVSVEVTVVVAWVDVVEVVVV